jgi:hypothetical protein
VHHAGPDELVLLLVNPGVEVHLSHLFRLAPVAKRAVPLPPGPSRGRLTLEASYSRGWLGASTREVFSSLEGHPGEI